MKNKIYVLSICWNEELTLPFFLKYYSFADKIIIFDNFSSDNSIEIMKKFSNVEFVKYNTNEQICDDIYLEIKNNLWKHFKNDCDWIIIVDIDEIVYHPLGLRNYLESLKNVAIIESYGFEMFTHNFDFSNMENSITNIKTGVFNIKHCKYNVINTKLVMDINYFPGCHNAYPNVNGIILKDKQLKMLHYKFIFPLPYLIYRYKLMSQRLSCYNKKNGLGFHYNNINNLITKYKSLRIKSKVII